MRARPEFPTAAPPCVSTPTIQATTQQDGPTQPHPAQPSPAPPHTGTCVIIDQFPAIPSLRPVQRSFLRIISTPESRELPSRGRGTVRFGMGVANGGCWGMLWSSVCWLQWKRTAANTCEGQERKQTRPQQLPISVPTTGCVWLICDETAVVRHVVPLWLNVCEPASAGTRGLLCWIHVTTLRTKVRQRWRRAQVFGFIYL